MRLSASPSSCPIRYRTTNRCSAARAGPPPSRCGLKAVETETLFAPGRNEDIEEPFLRLDTSRPAPALFCRRGSVRYDGLGADIGLLCLRIAVASTSRE